MLVIIPKEIEKITNQISKAENEKDALNDMLKFVGNDLLDGIES